MTIKIFKYIITFLFLFSSSLVFSQTALKNTNEKRLYKIFSRSYLEVRLGALISSTKVLRTSRSNYNYYNPAMAHVILTLSYGRHIKKHFWIKALFGLSSIIYDYKSNAPYPPLSLLNTYTDGIGGVPRCFYTSLSGVYYYPAVKNRIYIVGELGPSVIGFHNKRLGYEPTMHYYGTTKVWAPHKYLLGLHAGLEVDFRIGKRLLLFGNYTYNHLIFDSYIVHNHVEYYSYTGKVILYYDAEVKPYNDIFTIGAKFSLENSLFYKKKKKIGKSF